MSFAELGLAPELLRVIAKRGYDAPTPIQAQAIPMVLGGRDLLAAAQTGTGKTAAFSLPILHKLERRKGNNPRALILAPTRELAHQIADNVREYGRDKNLRTTVVYGGVSPVPQRSAFRRGVDIVIATPGRLLDHAQQRNIDLSELEMFVLDEADRMLDMGFVRDINKIIQLLPPQRQSMMFSATFSKEIRTLAHQLLNNPATVDVAPRNSAAQSVNQSVLRVNKDAKRAALSWIIGSKDWKQVLVFVRTRHGAERLCEQLSKDGLPSDSLHGDKSQGQRMRALKAFKSGAAQVLVATDIAGRGIDIDALPHVVNFELPTVPEDYVHRIGRTGRAGESGSALSLVSPDEQNLLSAVENMLGKKIPEMELEGEQAEKWQRNMSRATSQKKSGQRAGGGRNFTGKKPAAKRGAPKGRGGPGAGGRGNSSPRNESASAESRTRSDRPDRSSAEPRTRSERPDRSERPARSENSDRSQSAGRSRPASDGAATRPRTDRPKTEFNSDRPSRPKRADGGGERIATGADSDHATKPKKKSGPKRSGASRPVRNTKKPGRAARKSARSGGGS